MCEYCKKRPVDIIAKYEPNGTESYTTDYVIVWIEKNVLMVEAYLYPQSTHVSAKINYCPMCGRELKNENMAHKRS